MGLNKMSKTLPVSILSYQDNLYFSERANASHSYEQLLDASRHDSFQSGRLCQHLL